MKRCIICGHPYSENGTVCEICGNPYIDIPDWENDQEKGDVSSESRVPEKKKEPEYSSEEAASGKSAEEETIEKVEVSEAENEPEEVKTPDERKEPEETEVPEEADEPDEMAIPEENQSISLDPGRLELQIDLEEEEKNLDPEDIQADFEKKISEGSSEARRSTEETALVGERNIQEDPGEMAARNRKHDQETNLKERTSRGQNEQPVRPQGRSVQGQNDQPVRSRGARVYGQEGQPMRSQRESVQGQNGQPVRPQGSRGYGQNGQPVRPQGPTVYGQNGQPMRPQGPTVYGQNGQPVRPQGPTVYGQNGQPVRPQGRPGYGQNGQPVRAQSRPGYSQNGQPVRPQGKAPYGAAQGRPNAGAPRQTYGQRMIQESRKILHSPVFLVMTLLYTAAIAASVVSVFMQNLSFSQILQMLTNVDAPGELMAYVEKVVDLFSRFDSGAVVFALVSKIPDVFLCLGFWIAFLTSGKRREKIAGGGFLLARIGLIVKLVIGCILMLGCLLLAVTFVVSAWVSGVQTAEAASVIFLVAMIVLTMMIVMYFFCCLHTVKVCEWNTARGESDGKASAYTAVLTMLGALISVIMLLSSIVNMEIAGAVSAACSIGWMILMGLWILGYRKKVNNEKQ